jgi:hypothetical protein
VSTQKVPPQHAKPCPHPVALQPVVPGTHWPLWHDSPGAQMRPHPPQLFGSLNVLTQPFAQQSSPPPKQPVLAQFGFGGVQVPLTHESPSGQTNPHPPQFLGSVFVFAWQGFPSGPGPPSSGTQVSLVGSQVVPAGQGSPFAHDVLSGRPSSPWRDEREQPPKTATTRTKNVREASERRARGRDGKRKVMKARLLKRGTPRPRQTSHGRSCLRPSKRASSIYATTVAGRPNKFSSGTRRSFW